MQHVGLRSESDGFVEEEYYGIDSIWEIVALKVPNCLIDGIVAENIVDIGFDAGFQQHLDGLDCVLAPIPAHCHCPAVFPTELRFLWRHPVPGCGEVGDHMILPAELQNGFEIFVHIGVASAAQGDLVGILVALLQDPLEILCGHIGLPVCPSGLVTLDARFSAETGQSMLAMAHDPNIEEFRERGHEWVLPGVLAVNHDATSDIGSALLIEHGDKAVLFVDSFPHISISGRYRYP